MNTGSTQPNTSPNPAGLAISAIAHHRVVGTPRDLSPASSELHKIPPETVQAASKSSKKEVSQGTNGGSSSSLSAPSVVSKADALLSAAKNEEASTASTSGDGGDISSDSGEGISENDSVPVYIVTETRPSSATIFTPRKRELHFLSGQFRQDVESWMLLDDSDSDSDDDEADGEGEGGGGDTLAVNYTGTLNLQARHDGYRKSHEKGALVFASDLLASMNDDDIYDTDTETNIEDDTLQ
mmetsp:Transcript_472/g.1420  ORF Transcript_472/g.1420 Transcript_472/m.1420 type:complete len:240 (-) Transcript_472:110-829(-)|eukprot:CAMPEP_0181039192 /NCGR_PEP_ID=MMETSP1070-20121207/10335_1 /TAXON_ID=265543 /ORGANISM="Minutocellus polymorphus, Strain NH13" /LENGTH=239 /DNA_ID=CAMNT_0023117021 /DNA_START=100 /DNA_END=819 /DNA_ORIENTATION=-